MPVASLNLSCNIGLQAGIITPTLFTILVFVAIVTTLMATPIFEFVYGRHRKLSDKSQIESGHAEAAGRESAITATWSAPKDGRLADLLGKATIFSQLNAEADQARRRRAPATAAEAWTTEAAAKARSAKATVEAWAAKATVEARSAEAAAAATVKATAATVKATTAAVPAAPAGQLSLVDHARSGLRSRRGVRGTG
jgi:hypothetical protein